MFGTSIEEVGGSSGGGISIEYWQIEEHTEKHIVGQKPESFSAGSQNGGHSSDTFRLRSDNIFL